MTVLPNELRQKALARLAGSESADAQAALSAVFDGAIRAILTESRFDELSEHLDTLTTIGFKFPQQTIDAVASFIGGIEKRSLDYAEGYKNFASDEFFGGLWGPVALMAKALDALSPLRYLETRSVLAALLPLSVHHLEKCRNKALELLAQVASYDIPVFFGTKTRGGIGAYPQQEILTFIEGLGIDSVKANWLGAIVLIEKLLAERIKGTEWSYNKVVLSEIAIPASEQIADIRRRAISWTIEVYGSVETHREKSRLLGILNNATRDPRGSDKASGEMVATEALRIIDFFGSLVATEELQVVEKLESYVYWIFFHSPSEHVRAAALRFKSIADGNAEYQIFKVLIGFEGVFGEWPRVRGEDGNWDWKDKLRKTQAIGFIESITPGTAPAWRHRVLRYSKIESDDLATFPTYVFFLEKLAALRPDFALGLISNDLSDISRFLVPLLRGLAMAGKSEEVHRLIAGWIEQGVHLLQCAYALDDGEIFSLELLTRVLTRSIEAAEVQAIVASMAAVVSNSQESPAAAMKELFVAGLKALSEIGNSAWIFELWFRPKIKPFLAGFGEAQVALLLQNLLLLQEVDYHAEEILHILAARYPIKVLEFFVERMQAKHSSSKYEAVPFELHKVHEELSKHPAECVSLVRRTYEGDYGELIYGGAKLLKSIFPSYPPEFESVLLALVRGGVMADIEFVLAVLRNYDGEKALSSLCIAIVEQLPLGDPLLDEVTVVLESTGVVVGAFGFAEAMEKKRLEATAWPASPSDKVKTFSENYIAYLEKRIVEERSRATEQIALRKAQYGEY